MSKIQEGAFSRYWRLLGRLSTYYCEVSREFLRITVINGLKYLTFTFLTLWEKLFFLCCFIAVLYNSINFANNIMVKWNRFPVFTSLNPYISDITTEPFPAVTICNMNQVQRSKVKHFDVNSLDHAMLQKVCFQDINYTSFLNNFQLRSKNESFANFIVKNSQSCSDMIVLCQYGNVRRTCSDLFREVILDEGMCCSFNVIHPLILHKGYYFMVRDYTSIDFSSIALNWNMEDGYPQEIPHNFYPVRPLGYGISNGFTILLNGDLNNYFCSSTNGAGFKISFHNPADTPNVRETGLTVSLNHQTAFRIATLKEEADKSLRTSCTPMQRQCYFSDEYSLNYYRYYTRLNCEMECDAKFVVRKCNCLDIHMPEVYNNSTECHVKHFDCLVETEKDYVDPTLVACKKECLPNCNELSYITEAFFTKLDLEVLRIKYGHLRNVSKETLHNYALLQIFFSKKYYRGTVKMDYINFTEFLSQVGGLMSLMMGFSVISLVELAYFFVIKPLIYAWRSSSLRINRINISETCLTEKNANPGRIYTVVPPTLFAKPEMRA